jgi:hypothetical protein
MGCYLYCFLYCLDILGLDEFLSEEPEFDGLELNYVIVLCYSLCSN